MDLERQKEFERLKRELRNYEYENNIHIANRVDQSLISSGVDNIENEPEKGYILEEY